MFAVTIARAKCYIILQGLDGGADASSSLQLRRLWYSRCNDDTGGLHQRIVDHRLYQNSPSPADLEEEIFLLSLLTTLLSTACSS